MGTKAAFNFTPKNLDELKKLVNLAKKWNKNIFVTAKGKQTSLSDFLVNMKNFNRVLEIDMTTKRVTVEASTDFAKIKSYLEKVDLALSINGLPDEMTVAGAISTGTHSSSMFQGIISSYVIKITFLTAEGKVATCYPGEKAFRAIACGFGACGIILSVTLQCESTHRVKVQQFGCSFDQILQKLPESVDSSSNLNFLWFPHTNYVVVRSAEKINSKNSIKERFYNRIVNWIVDVGVEIYLMNIIYWICLFLPFLIPLFHYALFWLAFVWRRTKVYSPNQISTVQKEHEQKTEWVIPLSNAAVALSYIRDWVNENSHFLHFPIHVQFLQKDKVYLSPANEKDICCISLNVKRPFDYYFPFERAFAEFGDIMKRNGGRPNLGRTWPAISADDVDILFPYFDQWCTVHGELDPNNLFTNIFEES